MMVRFRKSITIAPGIKLNLSKSGVGLSGGIPGLRWNIGPQGLRFTANIPGTGIYEERRIGWSAIRGDPDEKDQPEQPAKLEVPPPRQGLLTGGPERRFREGCVAYIDDQRDEAYAAFAELVEDGHHLGDSRYMQAWTGWTLGNNEVAADVYADLLAWEGEPLPGDDDSLVTAYLPGGVVDVPITDFASITLPLDMRLVPFAMAELLQEAEDTDGAIHVLEQFTTQMPDARLLQLSLAEIYYHAGRYDALFDFVADQAGGLENEDNVSLEMMYYWARALTEAEFYDAAKDVYIRAIRKEKDRDPDLRNLLQYARADMFERWGKRADARRYFEKLFAQAPGFLDVVDRVKHLQSEDT
ncbi:MAG: DUF4236 domain-containing protein [Chloroflexi bacterium]|nr:DUF4236 domain-containing protein [Chloroflexota bacterium]